MPNSVKIYHYKRELKLQFTMISEKINDEKEHKQPIRLQKEEVTPRYTIFNFTKLETDYDVLYYKILAKRHNVDGTIDKFDYNICFTKSDYLILTGMTHRDTLLKYLTGLLHPKQQVFSIKYFSKNEIDEFVEKILEIKLNKMYRPRFYFSKQYRNRDFNDFIVSSDICATDDKEYVKMHNACFYYEPIFNIKKLFEVEWICPLKLNRYGHIYIQKSLSFDDWLKFFNTFLPRCL